MARFRFLLARFKPTTLLPLGDLLLVNLATLLALRLWAVRDGQEAVGWELMLSHVQWFLGLSALWLLMAAIQGLYRQRTLSRVLDSLLALLAITGLFLSVYVAVYFFAPVGMPPRRFVLEAGVLSLVLVSLWRVAYITISTGLVLARSASVGQRGGVTEFVREIIRETFASDGPGRARRPPSILTAEASRRRSIPYRRWPRFSKYTRPPSGGGAGAAICQPFGWASSGGFGPATCTELSRPGPT